MALLGWVAPSSAESMNGNVTGEIFLMSNLRRQDLSMNCFKNMLYIPLLSWLKAVYLKHVWVLWWLCMWVSTGQSNLTA